MRMSFMSVAAVALLAACSTAQERADYKADPANAMARTYGAGCEKLGYAKGSEQWRSCILRSSTHNDLAQWGPFYDRYPQRSSWNRTP